MPAFLPACPPARARVGARSTLSLSSLPTRPRCQVCGPPIRRRAPQGRARAGRRQVGGTGRGLQSFRSVAARRRRGEGQVPQAGRQRDPRRDWRRVLRAAGPRRGEVGLPPRTPYGKYCQWSEASFATLPWRLDRPRTSRGPQSARSSCKPCTGPRCFPRSTFWRRRCPSPTRSRPPASAGPWSTPRSRRSCPSSQRWDTSGERRMPRLLQLPQNLVANRPKLSELRNLKKSTSEPAAM